MIRGLRSDVLLNNAYALLVLFGFVTQAAAEDGVAQALVGDYEVESRCSYFNTGADGAVRRCLPSAGKARLSIRRDGKSEIRLPNGEDPPTRALQIIWASDHPYEPILVDGYQSIAALCESDDRCSFDRSQMGEFAYELGCLGHLAFGEVHMILDLLGEPMSFGELGYVHVCEHGEKVELLYDRALGMRSDPLSNLFQRERKKPNWIELIRFRRVSTP